MPLKIARILHLIFASSSITFAATGVVIDRENETIPLLFETIQAAVDAAQPGDTIRVHEGVYYENVIITGKHGTAEQPIVLEAAEGEVVILDGADRELQQPGSNRWQLDELAAAWSAEVPWQGNPDRALLTWASHADERLIAAHHDQEFFEMGKRGDALYRVGTRVLLRLSDEADPNELALNIGIAEGIIQFFDSSHWVVRGLSLKHAGFAGVHLKGPTVSDITIDAVTVETAFRGISTEEYQVGFSSRIFIRNCRILNFWDFNWEWKQGYQDHVRSSSDENAPMRGGAIHLRAHDSEIAHCEIAGQWDGIRVQGRNIQVHGNLLHHIKDDMMELESNSSTNIQVYENVGYQVFVAFSVVSNQKGPIYIYRNRVQANLLSRMYDDVWRFGYPLKFGNDWGPNASNLYIYHNTFDSNGRSMFVQRNSHPERWRNIEWVNNIFNRTESGALGLEDMGTPANGLVWEGNLFRLDRELEQLASFDPQYARAGFVGLPDLLDPTVSPPDLRIGELSEARSEGSSRALSAGWPDSVPFTSHNIDTGAIPFGSPAPRAGLDHPLYCPWDACVESAQ